MDTVWLTVLADKRDVPAWREDKQKQMYSQCRTYEKAHDLKDIPKEGFMVGTQT